MKRLVGTELSASGVMEKHWMHEEDGKQKLTIERVQDVEQILKRNKEAFNSSSASFGKSELGRVASIPAIVLEQACQIHKITFKELMAMKTDLSKTIWRELLNGRDFRAFRTKPGYVDIK